MDKKLNELIREFGSAAFACGEHDGTPEGYNKLSDKYRKTKQNLTKYIEEITVTKGGYVFEDLEVKKNER